MDSRRHFLGKVASGLAGTLVSPLSGRPEPAADVAGALFDHVRDALDEAGDTADARELLKALLARGNGAVFQRGTSLDRSLSYMIDQAAEVTAR